MSDQIYSGVVTAKMWAKNRAPLPKHSTKESIGHEGRATTIVELGDLDLSDHEDEILLTQVIQQLQEALDRVPEEHRATARLRLGVYGDYASASLTLRFERPETDDEMADRARWLSDINEESLERDKREFERLKAKFG